MNPFTLSAAPSVDIITAFGTVLDLAEEVVGFIQDNSFLVLFLAASLVPVAFRVFRSAKKSAK